MQSHLILITVRNSKTNICTYTKRKIKRKRNKVPLTCPREIYNLIVNENTYIQEVVFQIFNQAMTEVAGCWCIWILHHGPLAGESQGLQLWVLPRSRGRGLSLTKHPQMMGSDHDCVTCCLTEFA